MEDEKNTDLIKSNFLTYSNKTFDLKLMYPDYWTVPFINNDTMVLLSPINFSGMVINKSNYHDLDEFLYERIILQKKSLDDFQLIETYDALPFVKNNMPVKALMYLFSNDQNHFKAVEIMFNVRNESMYHISFVSNSSYYDTMVPTVNLILNSMSILKTDNDYEFGQEKLENETEDLENQTFANTNATDIANTNATDIANTNATESISLEETDPILTIPMGASTIGNPSFSPDTLTTLQGKTITVVNTDSAPHTVTSGEGAHDFKAGQLFDTSTMLPGSNSVIDTSALGKGDYQYFCSIHPFMKGVITIATK